MNTNEDTLSDDICVQILDSLLIITAKFSVTTDLNKSQVGNIVLIKM